MDEQIKYVEAMIERAGKSPDSVKALQFSQAALNVANAVIALRPLKNPITPPDHSKLPDLY